MSNIYVISGLTSKCAELVGEIGEVEKRLAQLQAEPAALDTTLRLFDPSAKPATIKPRVKRSAKHQVFKNGKPTRLTLSVLRKAERPMTVREIASVTAAECGLDMGTIPAANVVIANVRAALTRPHEELLAVKREREPMVYRVAA